VDDADAGIDSSGGALYPWNLRLFQFCLMSLSTRGNVHVATDIGH
jgi:hypothetical protein